MRKKKVIAILSVWTFIHTILLVAGIISDNDLATQGGQFCPNDYGSGNMYDITEFLFYVGGAWLWYFLYHYLKSDKE